jgi:hypothetical protein
MIVVAASMLKAGSSWFFNLNNDLVVAAGHQDGREMRERFHLQSFLTESDCTSRTLRIRRLVPISIPHWFGNTYTIKTAGKPTPAVKLAIDLGMMKAAFISRDPRDVTLSLFDHGEWIRREGIPSRTRFDALTTIEKAMEVAFYFTQLWEMWEKSRRAIMVRYEDLLKEPFSQMERIGEHIGMIVPEQNLRAIIERYQISNRANWQHDLHFNVGVAGRWKEKLSPAQQERAEKLFRPYLPRMGYES